MIDENEYSEIIQVIAYADPIIERWSERYGRPFPLDYQEARLAEREAS